MNVRSLKKYIMKAKTLKKYPSSTGRKFTFQLRDKKGELRGIISRRPGTELWGWVVQSKPRDSKSYVYGNDFASYDEAVASIEEQTQIVVS